MNYNSEKYNDLVKAYLESSPGNEPKAWAEMLAQSLSALAKGPLSKPAVEFEPVDMELGTSGIRLQTHKHKMTNDELVGLFAETEHVSICAQSYLTVVILPPRYWNDEKGHTNNFLCAQYHHIDKRIPGSAQRGIQTIVGPTDSGCVQYSRLKEYPDITLFFKSSRFDQSGNPNPWIDNAINGNLILSHRKHDDLLLGIEPYSDQSTWSQP